MTLNFDNLLADLYSLAHPDTESQEINRDQFYWSYPWRKLSKEIILRDNQECQVCKSEGRVTRDHLMVHHILPLEYYPEKKLNEDNLITVCIECHNTIHHGTMEPKWNDEWW